MTSYIEEVTALRRENAELRARLEELDRGFDRGVEGIARRMGVTVYQARLLAALASGHIMTRDQLERRCSRVDNQDPRHVDQQVKRIRRKSLPIAITTVYGAGYCLEGRSLETVRAAMKGH